VGLAQALDLALVAEGVESEAVAQCLLDEGCFRAQGFLFCKPIDAEEAQRLLAVGSFPITIAPTAPARP
jgi:EAL domain-containing protein (putative c-di-GMP-specific phosphodiesterase class I)